MIIAPTQLWTLHTRAYYVRQATLVTLLHGKQATFTQLLDHVHRDEVHPTVSYLARVLPSGRSAVVAGDYPGGLSLVNLCQRMLPTSAQPRGMPLCGSEAHQQHARELARCVVTSAVRIHDAVEARFRGEVA